MLSLDQIGMATQNPFARENLCHLPIGKISSKIKRPLTGLLRDLERSEFSEPMAEPVQTGQFPTV